jgi:hypothetical protein
VWWAGLSAIDGMAGIGETALAAHSVHRLADHTERPRPRKSWTGCCAGWASPARRSQPHLEARVWLYRSVPAHRRC